MALEFAGDGTPLTEDGLEAVRAHLDVGLPELWAVLKVETRGCGFLPDRRPLILFERHVFSQRTSSRFDAVAPDLSDREAGGYGAGGANQYDRLARAAALDRRAALESASWGIGQVMGFNFAGVGFRDLDAMIAAMGASEDRQLMAVGEFIGRQNLAGAMRAHDWRRFARTYNGPAFERNEYDRKLADAFARFSAGGLPDLRVRAAQIYLTAAGHDPGPIDGSIGGRTRAALRAFRRAEGLPDGDAADDATLERLRARYAA
ncbi:MAG: N-acetylmuramidase family protein [Alphaproteobacteria bacterium]|nr:N-acetylmuramidase family protein [Alphaproteobacteria bacterium]